VDLFLVTQTDVEGQGEEGTVAAEQKVQVLLGFDLGNESGCSNCARQIAVGLDEEHFTCLDVGAMPNCPATHPGHAAAIFPAPATPGVYPLIAEVPRGEDCHDPLYAFGHQFTGLEIGTLTVTAPCPAKDCAALDVQCGQWEDGCGSLVSCGVCAPGLACSKAGACEETGPCEQDLFEINEVFISGFFSFAKVKVASKVPLLFSWSLGSAAQLEGKDRQIVIGLEGKPGICIDVGEAEVCPASSAGLGSGNLQAPLKSGTFTVYALATAEESCDEALQAYPTAPGRKPVGTLEVSGECQAATCALLKADCGTWQDGCGGIAVCGACEAGKLCTEQAFCSAVPDCQSAVFELSQLQIGGAGPTAAVEASQLLPLTVAWKAGNPAACPGCARQLVVGYDSGVTAACFELGQLPDCPAFKEGSSGAFIQAPSAPGEHLLTAAVLTEKSCPAAEEAFPDAPHVPAGLLTVEGGLCGATCASLGAECGDWGDGCGGLLHCGTCAEGDACSTKGKCESPCVAGIFELTGVSLNNSGKTASSAPFANAQASVSFELGNPEDCADCKRQIVLGVEGEVAFCSEAGVPPACPAHEGGDVAGQIPAPGKAGKYSVYALAAFAESCTEASLQFANNLARVPVGTLYVTDGCKPANCLSMQKKCGQWEDGCGFLLDCGNCPAGQLCNGAGKCFCSGDDPYEPNDSAGSPHDLGTFTDKDIESYVKLEAGVEDEEDWFLMGSTDVTWAILQPYVHVVPGLKQSFKATVIYVCANGKTPSFADEIVNEGCTYGGGESVPGLGSVWAFSCASSKGEPMTIEFGPGCDGMDDSGQLLVGVSSTGPCSSYSLEMHL
jgi:hypothetical protein